MAALDNPHAAAVLQQQQAQWQLERERLEQARVNAQAAVGASEAGWARALDECRGRVAQLEAAIAGVRLDHAAGLEAAVANAIAEEHRLRDLALNQASLCVHGKRM